MANPMRTVSFKLPERLDDALNDLAQRLGSLASTRASE